MKPCIKNPFLLPVLIAGLGLIISCCVVKAQNNGMQYQIPTAEYNALVDLYNSTGGNAWAQNSGWLNGQAASWSGVGVVGVQYDTNENVIVQGHVNYIGLYYNQLSGTIPSNLGNLSQLQQLWLNGNQLSGAIPTSLGSLSQLQYLYLSFNQLSGSIPTSLGNLSQLLILSLYDNELSGNIPTSLSNLSNLQALFLAENQLSGTIPTSLGDLSQLQDLWLDDNQLSGSIPDSFGNLIQLQDLELDDNQLSGTIPTSLGNLSQLQTLKLYYNQLSGTIPTSLGSLSQLQTLYLTENQLSGTIPTSLGNLSQLQDLYLSENQLSGTIPTSLGSLSQLQNLDLAMNQLNGTIPSSLGSLSQLYALQLYDNQLSGSIPTSLGSLSQLHYLFLYGNQLSGDVPDFTAFKNVMIGVYNNFLNIATGSQSLENINAMISAGNTVGYFPQYGVNITGYVYCSCDQSPIANASVQIGPYSTTSANDGSYNISNISPGTYTAIVTGNNYISITNSIIIPSGSLTITQDFSLSPLPKLDYFGVGVDWKNVQMDGSPPYLLGDLDATNLYNALEANLSSVFNQAASVVVPLSATSTSINNLNAITTQFYQFTNNVCPNDTVVFYVNTHGGIATQYGLPSPQLSLASDYANNLIFNTTYIAGLLNSLPSSTRKVVILDACHSGWIGNLLVDSVPNTSALAACSGQLETIAGILYGAETPFNNDGTSVFGDALIVCLNNSVFDLRRISADINADTFGMYSSVIGSSLSLEDAGSAIFTGLTSQLWQSSEFTGNLTNNVSSVVQPPPAVPMPEINNASFQMTLTNVPTSGSIAIEMSTNLISWLQVSFNPATGTNQTFSFTMTNNSIAFFRTLVVP
jgi:Leucine-rich repeat (LRR) protein